MSELKVKEIILELDEKEIRLSLEEAQGLKKMLNAILRERTPINNPYSPPIIFNHPPPSLEWTCTTTYTEDEI